MQRSLSVKDYLSNFPKLKTSVNVVSTIKKRAGFLKVKQGKSRPKIIKMNVMRRKNVTLITNA